MKKFPLTLYDRYFVRQLVADIKRLHDVVPDLGPVDLARVRSMLEFDQEYTAPRNGFDGAQDYYRRASAGPLIPAIRIPGLVVHAIDDPFIPADPFFSVEFPSQIRLEVASRGGHLGFVSRRKWGVDRRWLDARFAHWLSCHWGRSTAPVLASDPTDADLDDEFLPTRPPIDRQAVPCPDRPNPPTRSAPPSPS
jgi:predicted alpha/beta-fold hydrolase